jgi:hypothetical protein
MRMHRYAPPALADLRSVIVGVALAAVIAGCGGSSSASSSSAPTNAVQSTPQGVALTTPQAAVRSYIEAIRAVNGNAMCNALDEGLQRSIMSEIVRARPAEAGVPCAQALAGFAGATNTPGEARAKLPQFHVTTSGSTATVTYLGTVTHEQHTISLVKRGPGWLIDKINGKG